MRYTAEDGASVIATEDFELVRLGIGLQPRDPRVSVVGVGVRLVLHHAPSALPLSTSTGGDPVSWLR